MVRSNKVKSRTRVNTKRKVTGKNSKRNVKRTSGNKRHSRKRQRGGNPVMISKLCESSKNGGSLKGSDSVSAAYVEELCNSPKEKQETQEPQGGGSSNNSGGFLSGIFSKMFSMATLPVSMATGTIKKVSGVDVGEVVKNNLNRVLNKTTEKESASNTSITRKDDRQSDTELGKFLSKSGL